MFVRTRGLFSGIADYTYSLDKVDLLHYGLEQQASIVSDYWLLKYFGLERNEELLQYRDLKLRESLYFLLQKYKNVLKGFPDENIFVIFILCILITGCPGGNRAPKNRFTFINGNRLCFSIDKNDVLNFYTIYSSKDHKITIVTGSGYNNLDISYPDTCLNIKWENGRTYVIHYGLNNKKYVHQFDVDNNGKQINLGEL